MNGTCLWPFTIGCFLLTYVAHSTILMLGVTAIIRWTKPTRPHVRKLIWRVALCGGVVTSVIQTVIPLPHWGARITLAMHEPEQGEEASAGAAPDMRTRDRLSIESASQTEQFMRLGGVTGAVRKPIETAAASSEPRSVGLPSWAAAAANLLFWLCLAGWACALFALMWQHIVLSRLVSNSRQITGGPLRRLVDRLGPRLGINRPVQLLSTPSAGVPMATGVRRLRICLPLEFLRQLDTEQVEALLAHELAHLARRDPMWNLIGFLTCRIFFYQPLNFYVRRQLSIESELVADQHAAGVLADPLGLARCLSTLGQWLSRDCRWQVAASCAVGRFSFRSQLGQRVERIVNAVSNGHWPQPNIAVWRTVIVSFVFAIVLIGPRAGGNAPDAPSHQKGASMNAVTARALIGSLAVSLGLSAVQADDERPQRLTERDVVKQRVEVFRIALKGLLEAEKEDAADVVQRAVRAREVMLEGRRDDEAHQIRERAPSQEQLARVLAIAADVWREFDNEEKAAVVGRVAKELAKQGERRKGGREQAERTERPTEREIVMRRIEVMKMAIPALREAERGEAVEVLERAIRGYKVALEGRTDEEAQEIRQRMPSRGQTAEILTMASRLWLEFDNEEKAAAVGRVAKELAPPPRDRERGRENAERQRRERTQRPTEREAALRRIEVMRLALPALREGERGDAVECLERAIRAYEVGLEGRRDEEANKIRQRMPRQGQLAEVLTMASNLWREFNNQDKAEVVGRLAKELAGRGGDVRPRSESRKEVIGFNGEVRGVVLEKGRENTIAFKVARVIRVWPKANKAENLEALVDRTIVIGPARDVHATFLSKLRPRQEVTLEIRGGERNRFVITELTQEQRRLATTD